MTLKTDQIQALMDAFERRKKSHKGTEVWNARDLMVLFGYTNWQQFRNLIFRAMDAMEKSGADPDDHFIQFEELILRESGGKRARESFLTSRAGAYLLTLETDTKEYEAAAFARVYFSTQARRAELADIQAQLEAEDRDLQRLDARSKLQTEEKGFQDILWSIGIKGAGIARIREEGNKILFGGYTTEDIRWRMGIGGTKRTPSDFLPTEVVLAKALAAALTRKKVTEEQQVGELIVGVTHVNHNRRIRQALIESGVYPEKSEPQEDIRLVERRIKARKKVASRAEPIPTLSVGGSKVVAMRPSIQQATHPSLFGPDES